MGSHQQIVERNITSLKPYAANARTHSRKQVKQIAASITRFGFTNPVLISDDDEIIAGHGRVEAGSRPRSLWAGRQCRHLLSRISPRLNGAPM